ncbi:hypothetical protein EMIT0P44_120100 [Pseudomonas sp. IT-P44]
MGHGAGKPRAGLVDAGVVVIAVLGYLCAVLAAGLGDRGRVAGTLLSDHCHQVAALLQDVGFLIAPRLDDGAEQRLAVLLQQRHVGLAVLVDQRVLANRRWQLAEVGAGAQVIVLHQIVGAHARAAAEQKQAEQGGGRRFHETVLSQEASPIGHVTDGAKAQLEITVTVRTVPWDEVMVAVGFADGITVVVLFTVSRQRPVTATVAVPRVANPVGVLTRMVTTLPVVTDEVPAKSQVKRLLERADTVAVVTVKVSAGGRGETCTVTVAGAVDWAPKLSRTK